MTEHFNGLSPAEAERIAMLMEEAGEVVQACGKILRHGLESRHPDGGPTNREALETELADLFFVRLVMEAARDVSAESVNKKVRLLAVSKKKERFTHHQPAGFVFYLPEVAS